MENYHRPYYHVLHDLLHRPRVRTTVLRREGRKTAVLGSIICGIIMALFAFVPAMLGLVALAEFPNIEANNAVATVALNLMPPIMAGFVMAAVVSATLSSGAGDLLGAATVFTKDIVEHHFGKASLMLSSLNIAVYACYSSASSPSLSPL